MWLDWGGDLDPRAAELMRHAQVVTTMNVYTNAMMETKRAANSKVVQMVPRPALKLAK